MKSQNMLLSYLVCGGILLYGLYSYLDRLEHYRIATDFQSVVEEKAMSIYDELHRNSEPLYALNQFYLLNDDVSHQEFQSFSRGFFERQRSLIALEWVPKVEHSERQRYEESLRGTFPHYHFVELSPQGLLVEAEERPSYYPIHYIEPYSNNQRTHGFDFGSEDIHLDVLNRARTSGVLQISRPISLSLGAEEIEAALLVLPVYDREMVPPVEREQRFKGLLVGAINLEQIVHTALDKTAEKALFMTLKDTTPETGIANDSQILFQYPKAHEVKSLSDDSFYSQTTVLQLGSRVWTLEATPTNSYIHEKQNKLTVLVLTLGGCFLITSAQLWRSQLRRTTEIEIAVEDKTSKLRAVNQKLEMLSNTDPLTGIANRRLFDRYLDQEFYRSRREKTPLVIMIIDIDQFKAYNDQYGHLMGDDCLKGVVDRIYRSLNRASDLLARIGGDEFGIILPNTNDALPVAQRILDNFEKDKMANDSIESGGYISVSIGSVVAYQIKDMQKDELIQLADQAVFRAKSNGRHRVEVTKIGSDTHRYQQI